MRVRPRVARYALVGWALLAGCGEAAPPGERPLSEDVAPGPGAALGGLQFDTVAVIGDPDGEAWEAFEGIWDVAVAPDGRFAVLDFQARVVHLYDGDGAHTASLSNRGGGPGELAGPTSIRWTSTGDLHVWDPANSRISRFAIGPAGPEFLDAREAFAFGETGFCAQGERVYLSVLQDGRVIHEIGTSGGQPVRSFSSPPEIGGIEAIPPGAREMALEDLTPAQLLCTASPAGVLEVSYFQPRIRMHDPDGALLWSRELAEFQPVTPYSPDEMGVGLRYAEETGSHLARSIVPWGDRRALIQYEVRLPGPRPEGRDFHALESRVIDLDTGDEEGRTRDLPLFLAASNGRVFQVRQTPHPQLVVLERR